MHHCRFLFLAFIFSLTAGILAVPVPSTTASAQASKSGSSSTSPTSTPTPKHFSLDGVQKLMASGKSCSKVGKGARDLTEDVPKECELTLPEDKKLVLRLEKDGPVAHGQLGEKLGNGRDGDVYDIEGEWSPGPGETLDKHVVAKWFKRKADGFPEIKNTNFMGELVGYGVDVRDGISRLWAILNWKKGKPLKLTSSYKAAAQPVSNGGNKKKCKAYMKKARDAILEACKPYLKLKGAPYQRDMHQGNALFWEEGEGEDVKLFANIVDWLSIDYGAKGEIVDDPEQMDDIVDDIEGELESGIIWSEKINGRPKPKRYDFTDKNNCF